MIDKDADHRDHIDEAEAGELETLRLDIQDELIDLDQSRITTAQARHVDEDLARIWTMKNNLRSSIRKLMSTFEDNNPRKVMLRQVSKHMVEEVQKKSERSVGEFGPGRLAERPTRTR